VKEGRHSLSVAQKLDVIKRFDNGEQSMDIVAASVLTVGLFLSEKTNFRVFSSHVLLVPI
jgi:hypothetical protein